MSVARGFETAENSNFLSFQGEERNGQIEALTQIAYSGPLALVTEVDGEVAGFPFPPCQRGPERIRPLSVIECEVRHGSFHPICWVLHVDDCDPQASVQKVSRIQS